MLEILYVLATPTMTGSFSTILTLSSILLGICSHVTSKKLKKVVFVAIGVLMLTTAGLLVNGIYFNINYSKVPDVQEFKYFAAGEKLKEADLQYKAPRAGDEIVVIYQYPRAGIIVRKNTYVDLYCEDPRTKEPVLYNYFAPETNDFMLVETNLRQSGDKGSGSWRKSISLSISDEFDVQIHCKNKSVLTVENFTSRVVLPEGVEYIPNSTMLFNSSNPDGLKISDNIIATMGVNIGNYASGANAYLRFKCILTDIPNNSTRTFVIWGQADSHIENVRLTQDYAEIRCIVD